MRCALFKRRKKLSFFVKLREFIWPSAGWRRAASYMRHRIARIDGTPYAIASGFACGAAVSFTPFVGLHFVIAALVAWIVRGNIFTSAIGTAVGNPWTFPIIWAVTYRIGISILGWDATDDLMAEMDYMFSQVTIVDIVNDPFGVLAPFIQNIFWPMLLGGTIIGFLTWGIFYWPIYKLVSEYQINRLKRRQMRRDLK